MKKKEATISIVAIGSELLDGKTQDTNTKGIITLLARGGYAVRRAVMVRDDAAEICRAFDDEFKKSTVIITTGGLGPTFDDITVRTIAGYAGKRCVFSKQGFAWMEAYFKGRAYRPRKRQAYIPAGARALRNYAGVAPGIIVECNNGCVIAIPGVPHEMQHMMERSVLPYLREQYRRKPQTSLSIKTAGIGEPTVEREIKPIIKVHEDVAFGIYPKLGEVEVKAVISDVSAKRRSQKKKKLMAAFNRAVGDWIYGYDDDTVETVLVSLLKKKKKTLSCAESCTGGLIGKTITDVPGASAVFKGGCVVYANEAKETLLRVPHEIIQTKGAVSAEVAGYLAANVRTLFQTDYGIAVTGIAGPGGGTKTKPVGLVWGALASSGGTRVFQWRFPGARELVRIRTMKALLFELVKIVKMS